MMPCERHPDQAICPIILCGHTNYELKIELNINDVIVCQQRIRPVIALYLLSRKK